MFFDRDCAIIDIPTGDQLPDEDTTFRCAIWPAGSNSTTSRGEAYDFSAQVEVDAADHLVRGANRKLVIDGETYSVVGADLHRYVPHVACRLLELRPGG